MWANEIQEQCSNSVFSNWLQVLFCRMNFTMYFQLYITFLLLLFYLLVNPLPPMIYAFLFFLFLSILLYKEIYEMRYETYDEIYGILMLCISQWAILIHCPQTLILIDTETLIHCTQTVIWTSISLILHFC